jgi:hypothetical protein
LEIQDHQDREDQGIAKRQDWRCAGQEQHDRNDDDSQEDHYRVEEAEKFGTSETSDVEYYQEELSECAFRITRSHSPDKKTHEDTRGPRPTPTTFIHETLETLETSATSSDFFLSAPFEDVRIGIRRLLPLSVSENTSANNAAAKRKTTSDEQKNLSKFGSCHCPRVALD